MPLQRPKHCAPGIGLTPALHCKFGHCQAWSTSGISAGRNFTPPPKNRPADGARLCEPQQGRRFKVFRSHSFALRFVHTAAGHRPALRWQYRVAPISAQPHISQLTNSILLSYILLLCVFTYHSFFSIALKSASPRI